jgi:hypothetical protein
MIDFEEAETGFPVLMQMRLITMEFCERFPFTDLRKYGVIFCTLISALCIYKLKILILILLFPVDVSYDKYSVIQFIIHRLQASCDPYTGA